MNNNISSTARPAALLNMLFLAILLTLSISPFLNQITNNTERLGLVILWFFTTVGLKTNHVHSNSRSFVKWWVAFWFWQLLMSFIGHSSKSLYEQLSLSVFNTYPLIGLFIIKRYNFAEKKIFLRLLLAIFLFNILQNFYLAYRVPGIFQMADYTVTNAGNTDMVMCLTFIVPPCIYFVSNFKKIDRLIAYMLIVTIPIYIMFVNARTTSSMLFIIFIAGIFLIKREPCISKKVKSYYIRWIIIISTAIFLLLIPVVTYLSSVSIDRQAERFTDITSVLQGGDIEANENGSLAARFLLAQTSINTFLASSSNFLIGIGDDIVHGADKSLYTLISLGIGNHSEFFDLLAKFGIIGGVFFCGLYLALLKYLLSLTVSRQDRHFVILFMIVFFLQSLLNHSLIPLFHITVFFILPLILNLYKSYSYVTEFDTKDIL